MSYIRDAYGFKEKPQGLDEVKFREIMKSAEAGDATAQFRLACCYFNGWEVKTSKRNAYEWWQKAAK